MTDDKKVLADQPGFRVGPGGVVEVFSAREVDALIVRAIREAIEAALTSGCRGRTIH